MFKNLLVVAMLLWCWVYSIYLVIDMTLSVWMYLIYMFLYFYRQHSYWSFTWWYPVGIVCMACCYIFVLNMNKTLTTHCVWQGMLLGWVSSTIEMQVIGRWQEPGINNVDWLNQQVVLNAWGLKIIKLLEKYTYSSNKGHTLIFTNKSSFGPCAIDHCIFSSW